MATKGVSNRRSSKRSRSSSYQGNYNDRSCQKAEISKENVVVRFSEAVDGFPLPKGHDHTNVPDVDLKEVKWRKLNETREQPVARR